MDIQPWFETDAYQQQDSYRNMSPSWRRRIDDYRRDGFLVVDEPVIDEVTSSEIVASLAGQYVQSATGYSSPGRIQDAWQTAPAVGRLAGSPTVLDILRTLYQKNPIPFQTLNFDRGTEQRAHSDTVHFNSLPFGFMCGVWVALEDIDLNNGPLRYFPGSQRLPVFHMSDLGLEAGAEQYQHYEDRVEEILAKGNFKPQIALLKRGQALIWSANLFHGGSKVLDPQRTRLSQVTHYYFPGCIYYTPLLSAPEKQAWTLRQVKDIRTGEVQPNYQGLPSQGHASERKRRRRFRDLRLFRGKEIGS